MQSAAVPGSGAPTASIAAANSQSPSVSIIVAPRQHSMIVDVDANSNDQQHRTASFSRSNVHMPSIFSSGPNPSAAGGASGTTGGLGYSAAANAAYGRSGGAALSGGRTGASVFKYEAEFQELQLILLWFPEEVRENI